MNLRNVKIIILLTLIIILSRVITYGQTDISGIINTYTKVTAVDVLCNSVTVSPTTGFGPSDKVLLIQMQGATIDLTNTAAYGNVTAIGNAGNYEFNEILGIVGSVVYLKYTMAKTYTATGSVQLIKIPQYIDANVIGTLTAKAWDGTTGGVLVFQASGTVTLNANIDVGYQGFRGGLLSLNSTAYNCTNTTGITSSNNYFYTHPSYQGGQKGEGISAVGLANQAGKGKTANGGGGGNGHNSGGAGGGNYGAGGSGGTKDSRNTALCTGGCGNGIYPNGPGVSGLSLSTQYASNKIFMGGGGGGGHEDNSRSFDAGNGGGIVILTANSISNSGGYSILANGDSVKYDAVDNGDGNSGGGAGGTVLLSASTVNDPITIDVTGGRGGNTNGGGFACRYFGPGGGGGGGVVWLNSSNANIASLVAGGIAGYSFTYFGNYGATAGGDGASLSSLSIPQSTTVFNPACIAAPITLIDFSGNKEGEAIHLYWTTASEKNNSHFVIEKSKDGINYFYLTTIGGQGNSSTLTNYSYKDISPLMAQNYYCLKQYDLNGNESIVGYFMMDFNGANNRLIQKIYPNPFTNELVILSLEVFNKSTAEVKLTDIFGVEVTSAIYLFDGSSIKINTSEIERGLYFFKLTYNGKTEIRKVIKE